MTWTMVSGRNASLREWDLSWQSTIFWSSISSGYRRSLLKGPAEKHIRDFLTIYLRLLLNEKIMDIILGYPRSFSDGWLRGRRQQRYRLAGASNLLDVQRIHQRLAFVSSILCTYTDLNIQLHTNSSMRTAYCPLFWLTAKPSAF